MKSEPNLEPTFSAKIILFCVRWRSRLPAWRLETMARLVTSEVEGIQIIEQVLPGVNDPQIRKILNKHLDDERRHATVFSERFEALLTLSGSSSVKPPLPRAFEKRMNLMALVAYLEIQEARAIPLLRLYTELYSGDEATVSVIKRNLRDETFHATWTYRQLEQWIAEGRGHEVMLARREARRIDRRAFWLQVLAFLKALPGLLARGVLPQLGAARPAPLL